MSAYLILGCGFTGKRVASALAASGATDITVTTRDSSKFGRNSPFHVFQLNVGEPDVAERLASLVRTDTAVLYSIPPILPEDPTPRVLQLFQRARRMVYLSTTGVYGDQRDVDEYTRPSPRTTREHARAAAERAALESDRSLVLRPAAIYGPQRGIQSAMRAGTYQLGGNGENYVSRIHVDDLVRHCVAGLRSEVKGAWPVGDEEPCRSKEIASFCAELLGVSMPVTVEMEQLGETRRADRRVDGSAIRRVLGIDLQYPSYRTGIPACIEAERAL